MEKSVNALSKLRIDDFNRAKGGGQTKITIRGHAYTNNNYDPEIIDEQDCQNTIMHNVKYRLTNMLTLEKKLVRKTYYD